jgi:hypothetical protein
MSAAQYQSTIEQHDGTNENGLQEYGWMTRLLMVFNLTCLKFTVKQNEYCCLISSICFNM